MTPIANHDKIDLHKLWVRVQNELSERELAQITDEKKLQAMTDLVADMLVVRLDAFVYGGCPQNIEIHEKYPADWIEAFKDRWLPEWLKKRFPIRYTHIDRYETVYAKVCPHLGEQHSRHFMFLADKESEEGCNIASPLDLFDEVREGMQRHRIFTEDFTHEDFGFIDSISNQGGVPTAGDAPKLRELWRRLQKETHGRHKEKEQEEKIKS